MLVLLGVEIQLNNRPLSYVEDDVELPILTPNSVLFGRSKVLPEEDNTDEHVEAMDNRVSEVAS